jgi:pimeloyl-ACP methyl ester carboxylesterase
LFGTSYGTHLAVNVIKRHGANLDRVVLAGVEGPDHTYKLPENIERNLEQIFSLYKSDAAISKRIPDFKTLIINLMNQLEKHPAMVELTDPETKQKVVITVGHYDLQYLLAGYLPGRIAAIRNFPKIAYQMSKGDFSFIAGTMLAARRSALGSAMKFMMDCSSGASQKRQQLIKRQGRQAIVGDFANYPYPQICQAWQGTKLSKDFYKPVKSQTPVLLISGTLDGRTPASNAEEIIKGFPNGFHLLVEGAGHVDSSMFLPKVQESLLKFLKGESLNETEFTAKALEFAPIP